MSISLNALSLESINTLPIASLNFESYLDKSLDFILGSSNRDSIQDQIFYQLFMQGKIDSLGICISSEEWKEIPDSFKSKEANEIKEFLNQEIEITCVDKITKETFSSKITLYNLFLLLTEKTSAEIVLIGSHLSEIAVKHNWLAYNLQKISLTKIPEDLFKPENAGDSDWRFFPCKTVEKEQILSLIQETIVYFANTIYKDEKNRSENASGISSNIYQQHQNVRESGLLNRKYFQSEDKSIAYGIISFGKTAEKPIDLMFIQKIQKTCLFNLDDFNLKVSGLQDEYFPTSTTSNNLWQFIIDKSLNIIHCPNLDMCDDMGWLRLLRHLTKGARFFEEKLDLKLFEKITLTKLPDQVSKYFNKLYKKDPTGAFALYCHVLIFLKQNSVSVDIIDPINSKLPKILNPQNVFEWFVMLLQKTSFSFELIYSLIHSTLFLHLGTSSNKVYITKLGSAPVFQISDTYSLFTSGSIKESISELTAHLSKNSFSESDCKILEQFLNFLLPSDSYTQEIDHVLIERLKHFDMTFDKLLDIGLMLIEKPFPLNKLGLNYLNFSFCYANDKENIIKHLFRHFPQIMMKEENSDDRKKLESHMFKIVDSSFKPLFNSSSNEPFSISHYIESLISLADFSTYKLVLNTWQHNELENETKKSTGIKLLEKLAKYDLNAFLIVFKNLLSSSLLSPEEALAQFKLLTPYFSSKICLEKLNILTEMIWVHLRANIHAKPFQYVENELLFLIEQLSEKGLKKAAENLFLYCLNNSSIPKELDLQPFQDILTEGSTLQIYLKREDLQNALFYLDITHSKHDKETIKTLTLLIEKTLNNKRLELDSLLQNLLLEKVPFIFQSLFFLNENSLCISLLLSMLQQNLEIELNEELIQLIFTLILIEINTDSEVTKLYAILSMMCSQIISKTSENEEFMERFSDINEIMSQRLLQIDPSEFVNYSVDLIKMSEVEDLPAFLLHLQRMLLGENALSLYLRISENLLLLVKETKEPSDYLEKLLQIIFTFEFLPPRKASTFSLALMPKCFTSKHVDLFNLGAKLGSDLIRNGLLEEISDRTLQIEFKNAFFLMVEEANKCDALTQDHITSSFIPISDIALHYPAFFSLVDTARILKGMLQTKSNFTLTMCGELIVYILKPLNKKADKALIDLALKFIDKALEHLQKFPLSFFNPQNLSPAIILCAFVALENFELHFEESLKVKLFTKIICCKMEMHKNALDPDFESIQSVLQNVVSYIPLITKYPHLEYEVLDKAFDLLPLFIQKNYPAVPEDDLVAKKNDVILRKKDLDKFNLYLFNLLRGITNSPLSKSDPKLFASLNNLKDPVRFFNCLSLMCEKLLKAPITDLTVQSHVLDLTINTISTMLSTAQKLITSSFSVNDSKIKNSLKKIKELIFSLFDPFFHWKPAHKSQLANRHLQFVLEFTDNSDKLGFFNDKQELYLFLALYLNLDPAIIIKPLNDLSYTQILDKSKSMIVYQLNFDSDFMIYRAIDLYGNTQNIQIKSKEGKKNNSQNIQIKSKRRKAHNKIKPLIIESNGLLDCFNLILSTLSKNPCFETYLSYDNDDILISENPTKTTFIINYFQAVMFNNPHIKNERSSDWSKTFLTMCTSWYNCLKTLHDNEVKDPKFQNILFFNLNACLLEANNHKCFSENPNALLPLLTDLFDRCFPLFKVFDSEDVVHMKEELMKEFFKKIEIPTLFKTGKLLNKQELKNFQELKDQLLLKLEKVDSIFVKDFVKKLEKDIIF